MKLTIGLLALTLACSAPAYAQRGGGGHGGGGVHGGGVGGGAHGVGHGFIPQRGPAPMREGGGIREEGRRDFRDEQGHPNAPHVHNDGAWIGHDTGRGDAHFRSDHPFAHGRFTGGVRSAHLFRLRGGDKKRRRFEGLY